MEATITQEYSARTYNYVNLTKIIGLHASTLFNQIHYWLQRCPKWREGKPWIYNNYQAWQAQLGINYYRVSRSIKILKDNNLIIVTDKYNKDKRDRTLWYTINYDHVWIKQLKLDYAPPTIAPEKPKLEEYKLVKKKHVPFKESVTRVPKNPRSKKLKPSEPTNITPVINQTQRTEENVKNLTDNPNAVTEKALSDINNETPQKKFFTPYIFAYENEIDPLHYSNTITYDEDNLPSIHNIIHKSIEHKNIQSIRSEKRQMGLDTSSTRILIENRDIKELNDTIRMLETRLRSLEQSLGSQTIPSDKSPQVMESVNVENAPVEKDQILVDNAPAPVEAGILDDEDINRPSGKRPAPEVVDEDALEDMQYQEKEDSRVKHKKEKDLIIDKNRDPILQDIYDSMYYDSAQKAWVYPEEKSKLVKDFCIDTIKKISEINMNDLDNEEWYKFQGYSFQADICERVRSHMAKFSVTIKNESAYFWSIVGSIRKGNQDTDIGNEIILYNENNTHYAKDPDNFDVDILSLAKSAYGFPAFGFLHDFDDAHFKKETFAGGLVLSADDPSAHPPPKHYKRNKKGKNYKR